MTRNINRLGPDMRAAVLASRIAARTRRERNRAAGLCINASRRDPHGPLVTAVRCEPCAIVHKHGKAAP
jgi:hypothetical protein